MYALLLLLLLLFDVCVEVLMTLEALQAAALCCIHDGISQRSLVKCIHKQFVCAHRRGNELTSASVCVCALQAKTKTTSCTKGTFSSELLCGAISLFSLVRRNVCKYLRNYFKSQRANLHEAFLNVLKCSGNFLAHLECSLLILLTNC